MTLVVLASMVTMGTALVPGASGYSWEIHYRDGQVVALGQTTEPRITFTPRTGRCFNLIVCSEPEHLCSPESGEICADPLVGDTSPFDGVVGGPDYINVGSHFGETAP